MRHKKNRNGSSTVAALLAANIAVPAGFWLSRVFRPEREEEPERFFDLREKHVEGRQAWERRMLRVIKPEAGECRISSEMWQEKNRRFFEDHQVFDRT